MSSFSNNHFSIETILRLYIYIFNNWIFFTAIEAQIREIQAKKNELPENGSGKGVSLGDPYYDSDIYDNAGHTGKSRYDGYVTSIAANDEVEDEDVENVAISQKRPGYTAPASLLNDIAQVMLYWVTYNLGKMTHNLIKLPWN